MESPLSYDEVRRLFLVHTFILRPWRDLCWREVRLERLRGLERIPRSRSARQSHDNSVPTYNIRILFSWKAQPHISRLLVISKSEANHNHDYNFFIIIVFTLASPGFCHEFSTGSSVVSVMQASASAASSSFIALTISAICSSVNSAGFVFAASSSG